VSEKGLAKNSSARYQTALELADAARSALPRKRTGIAGKPELAATKPKALRETVRSVAISFDVGEHCVRPDDARGRSWTVWRLGVSEEGTGARVARHQDVPSGGYVLRIVCSILLPMSAAVLVAVRIAILTT
jgi:hypothetical protein